jgi:hypothetical protein
MRRSLVCLVSGGAADRVRSRSSLCALHATLLTAFYGDCAHRGAVARRAGEMRAMEFNLSMLLALERPAECGRVWPLLLRRPWRRAGTTISIQPRFVPRSRQRGQKGTHQRALGRSRGGFSCPGADARDLVFRTFAQSVTSKFATRPPSDRRGSRLPPRICSLESK